MLQRVIKEEALGYVLSIRVILGIGGNKLVVGCFSGQPFGGMSVVSIKGSVGCFVHQGFLEDARCKVLLGLSHVDEQVVVSSAKRVVAFVNPDGFQLLPQAFRQTTYDRGELKGFRSGRIHAFEFRVDLNFHLWGIAETGLEQEGVAVHPTFAAIVHFPHA